MGKTVLPRFFQKLDRKAPRLWISVWANPSNSFVSVYSRLCAFSSVLQVEKERKPGINFVPISARLGGRLDLFPAV